MSRLANAEVHVLAEADCPHYDCQGPLEPGQYHATYFDPTIAFEIATPGWTWSYTGSLQMFASDEAAEGYGADVINFFLDPVIAAQDCEEVPNPAWSGPSTISWRGSRRRPV